jgi:hypothetical protein
MPRVVRERFWDLVRSGVAPGDAGVAAGSADGARRWFRVAGGVKGDLPRTFRTADLWLIHAADCCSRYSLWTCCGVRY